MSKSTGTAIDWVRVRADYVGGSGTVVAIGERHGVSDGQIRRRARVEGWPRRTSPCREKVVGSEATPLLTPRRAPKSSRSSRAVMIRQLYRLVAQNLKRMETAMTTDDPASPADKERETRAIGKLIQNVERVTELETDRNRGAKPRSDADGKSGEPGPLTPEETQRLSLELAERLYKLAERARAGRAE